MPTPTLTEDAAREAARYLTGAVADGYVIGSLPSAYAEAARRMVADGVSRSVNGADKRLRHPITQRILAGIDMPDATNVVETENLRRETHDLTFWKRKAQTLEKELAKAELAARELAGVRDVAPDAPDWLITPSATKHRAVIGAFLSDLHCGEVVRPDEIGGLNGYDIDTFRRRLRRYISAVCQMGPRWLSDCEPVGCLLALGGDLISGDIHEELRITNALTAHEQVRVCVEELEAGIRHLADTFGRVHVPCVPGNHGRTTLKPSAKLYAALSYDTMVGAMLEDRFAADERVTFQVASGADAIIPVLGWHVLLTHGDKMGTGGGQGFAGPLLPIIRGGKKIQHQHWTSKTTYDLLLTGHFHTSGQLGPHLSNGSMVGYAEYAHGIRAATEPPQQWAFTIHEKWLLRDHAEVKLEDPSRPEKPRVRVPAWNANT